MSRLSRARGIALAWTRVGRAKPASARARSIRGSRICEKEANVAFLSTRWTSAIRVESVDSVERYLAQHVTRVKSNLKLVRGDSALRLGQKVQSGGAVLVN